MATEFKLPELGENITAGDVVRVLVSVGDRIEIDQPVIEIETDKAVFEVPSTVAGVVNEILIKEGDKAQVGQTLVTLESAEAKDESVKPNYEQIKNAPVPNTATDNRAGRQVAQQEEDQRDATPDAPEQRIDPAQVQPITASNNAAPQQQQQASQTGTTQHTMQAATEIPVHEIAPAAPSTRRVARELGVDINMVRGSGPGGRISVADVQQYVQTRGAAAPQQAAAPQPSGIQPEEVPQPVAAPVAAPHTAIALPDFAKWGAVERKAMSNIRRATAVHLSEAWTTIPHVTQYDKTDITDLEALRKQFGKRAEEAGGKLTITAILLKVIVSALRKFPQFNSSVDMSTNEIVYKQYYHIGVAVDTDRGLLVPVIRDVDKKSVIDLSVELNTIADKARNRKLGIDDMSGGTFTITNLGGIGGTYFAPIVNHPEVAILGVSRASMEPVYKEGQFVPRLMLPLSLSYDHRVIDGADGIRFLRFISETLEQPFLIALS